MVRVRLRAGQLGIGVEWPLASLRSIPVPPGRCGRALAGITRMGPEQRARRLIDWSWAGPNNQR